MALLARYTVNTDLIRLGSSTRTPNGRGGRAVLRGAWRVSRPVLFQLSLAVGIALVLASLIKHDRPVGAPLFAVAGLELVIAKRHRHLAWLVLGIALGLSFTAVVSQYRTFGHVAADVAIGVVTAFVVVIATIPRTPAKTIGETLDPLLSRLTTNVRAVAGALRSNDANAAAAAVYDLAETNEDLRRLDEVLKQARRSAVVTLWTTGQDLEVHATTAREVGNAVHNIRMMARHAWWGVLRGGERVPVALPQMLDTLADGIGVLRDEMKRGRRLSTARPLLISAARWVEVIDSERTSMATSAVAASANAAVLNLLVATGLPLVEADDRLHLPHV